MKPVRSLALLLLACTLVGMGFFLPWLGAAWQDAAMEQTTTQYEVTPLLDNDLSSHLKLVANGYTVFALSEASPRLSPAQTETAAVAALYDMDNLGLTFLGQDHLFSPDTWQFSSASPFVAMGSGSPDYEIAPMPRSKSPQRPPFPSKTSRRAMPPPPTPRWLCSGPALSPTQRTTAQN